MISKDDAFKWVCAIGLLSFFAAIVITPSFTHFMNHYSMIWILGTVSAYLIFSDPDGK